METYSASISLGEESSQMCTLNKRLESYFSRVKTLEKENERLRAEIHHLKSTKSDSCVIRKYHNEIMKLRDALDDGHQEMIEMEMTRDNIYQEIQYVKELCLQEKQAHEEVKKELTESKKILEEEKRAQSWLKGRLVQLEEEVEDILKVHEEEKAAMEEEILSYTQRLENFKIAPVAFQPVNVEDYASRLSQIWQGAVEEYKNEVSALEDNLAQTNENLRRVLDENKQSQLQLQNLDRELQSLKSRKEMLEEMLSKQWLDHQEDEGNLQLEIEVLEKEKQDLRAQIAQILEDRQQLMHLKMSLSLEVATYRSLLEAENTRIYPPSVDYKVLSSFNDSLLDQKIFRKRQPENRESRLNTNKRQNTETSTPKRYPNVKSTSYSSRTSPITKEFQKVSSVLQSQNLRYAKGSSKKAATPLPSVERNSEKHAPNGDISKKTKVETINHSYTGDSSKAVTEEITRKETRVHSILNKNVFNAIDTRSKKTDSLSDFLLPEQLELVNAQLKANLQESSLEAFKNPSLDFSDFVLEDQQNSLKNEDKVVDVQVFEKSHEDKRDLDVPQTDIISTGFQNVFTEHITEKCKAMREVVSCQKVYLETEEIVESQGYQNMEATIKENARECREALDFKEPKYSVTEEHLVLSSQIKEQEKASISLGDLEKDNSDVASDHELEYSSSKEREVDDRASFDIECFEGQVCDAKVSSNPLSNKVEEHLQLTMDVEISHVKKNTSNSEYIVPESNPEDEDVTISQQFHELDVVKETSNQLFEITEDITKEIKQEHEVYNTAALEGNLGNCTEDQNQWSYKEEGVLQLSQDAEISHVENDSSTSKGISYVQDEDVTISQQFQLSQDADISQSGSDHLNLEDTEAEGGFKDEEVTVSQQFHVICAVESRNQLFENTEDITKEIKEEADNTASVDTVTNEGLLGDSTEGLNLCSNKEEDILQLIQDSKISIIEKDTSISKDIEPETYIQDEEVTISQQFHKLSAVNETSNQLFENADVTKEKKEEHEEDNTVSIDTEHSECDVGAGTEGQNLWSNNEEEALQLSQCDEVIQTGVDNFNLEVAEGEGHFEEVTVSQQFHDLSAAKESSNQLFEFTEDITKEINEEQEVDSMASFDTEQHEGHLGSSTENQNECSNKEEEILQLSKLAYISHSGAGNFNLEVAEADCDFQDEVVTVSQQFNDLSAVKESSNRLFEIVEDITKEIKEEHEVDNTASLDTECLEGHLGNSTECQNEWTTKEEEVLKLSQDAEISCVEKDTSDSKEVEEVTKILNFLELSTVKETSNQLSENTEDITKEIKEGQSFGLNEQMVDDSEIDTVEDIQEISGLENGKQCSDKESVTDNLKYEEESNQVNLSEDQGEFIESENPLEVEMTVGQQFHSLGDLKQDSSELLANENNVPTDNKEEQKIIESIDDQVVVNQLNDVDQDTNQESVKLELQSQEEQMNIECSDLEQSSYASNEQPTKDIINVTEESAEELNVDDQAMKLCDNNEEFMQEVDIEQENEESEKNIDEYIQVDNEKVKVIQSVKFEENIVLKDFVDGKQLKEEDEEKSFELSDPEQDNISLADKDIEGSTNLEFEHEIEATDADGKEVTGLVASERFQYEEDEVISNGNEEDSLSKSFEPVDNEVVVQPLQRESELDGEKQVSQLPDDIEESTGHDNMETISQFNEPEPDSESEGNEHKPELDLEPKIQDEEVTISQQFHELSSVKETSNHLFENTEDFTRENKSEHGDDNTKVEQQACESGNINQPGGEKETCLEEDGQRLTSTVSQSQVLGNGAEESLNESDNIQFSEPEPIIQSYSEAYIKSDNELENCKFDNSEHMTKESLNDAVAEINAQENEDFNQAGENSQENEVEVKLQSPDLEVYDLEPEPENDHISDMDTNIISQQEKEGESHPAEYDAEDTYTADTKTEEHAVISENPESNQTIQKEPEENLVFSLNIIQNNLRFTSDNDEAIVPDQQEQSKELCKKNTESSGEIDTVEKVQEQMAIEEGKDEDICQSLPTEQEYSSIQTQQVEHEHVEDSVEETTIQLRNEYEDIIVEHKKATELLHEKPSDILDYEMTTEQKREFEDIPESYNVIEENSRSDDSLDSQDISICSQKSEEFEISKDYQLEQTLPDTTPLPSLDDEFDQLADSEIILEAGLPEDVPVPEVTGYKMEEAQTEQFLDRSLECQSSKVSEEKESLSLSKGDEPHNIAPEFDQQTAVLEDHAETEYSESEDSFNSQEEVIIPSEQSALNASTDFQMDHILIETTPLPDHTEISIRLVEDQSPEFECGLNVAEDPNEHKVVTEDIEQAPTPEHCQPEIITFVDAAAEETATEQKENDNSEVNEGSIEKEEFIFIDQTEMVTDDITIHQKTQLNTEEIKGINRVLDQYESVEDDTDFREIPTEEEHIAKPFYEVKFDHISTESHSTTIEESEIQHKISLDNSELDENNVSSESDDPVSSDDSSPNVTTISYSLEVEEKENRTANESNINEEGTKSFDDLQKAEFEEVPIIKTNESETLLTSDPNPQAILNNNSDSTFDSDFVLMRGEPQGDKQNTVNGLQERTIVQAILNFEDHKFNGHSNNEQHQIVISETKTVVRLDGDIVNTHNQDSIKDSETNFAMSEGNLQGLLQSLEDKQENIEGNQLYEVTKITNTIHAAVDCDESAAKKYSFASKAISSYLNVDELNDHSEIKLVNEDITVDTNTNQEVIDTQDVMSLKYIREREDSWSSDD